jgi:hypothetical protein
MSSYVTDHDVSAYGGTWNAEAPTIHKSLFMNDSKNLVLKEVTKKAT